MNSTSDMVSYVFSSTKITTKYMKPSYETISIDSDNDIVTIYQVIKKRRATTFNTAGLDVSHEINPHPIVTIDPSLIETEMPFNSHLIIEDIAEAERNSDVDDFLINHDPNHDPAPNFDCELALNLHIAEVVEPHVFADLESFFNQNSSAQVINTQLVQTDKKKINAAKKGPVKDGRYKIRHHY
ncbi:hypothetical protein FNV43_RR00686 [Rhamnella rubrinervis]|uniref:Uncharacterized protein n=1 Tax=Rhamnella rubrinervis TaxID=2594499 RepID=A0A8K0HR44_9ROSA|nr:hypothetical protein FNV43_RR00686 [Rhamnella rubrinervis]